MHWLIRKHAAVLTKAVQLCRWNSTLAPVLSGISGYSEQSQPTANNRTLSQTSMQIGEEFSNAHCQLTEQLVHQMKDSVNMLFGASKKPKKRKTKKDEATGIVPPLTKLHADSVQRVAGLEMNSGAASYCVINRNLTVEQWQNREWNLLEKKMSHAALKNEVANLVSELPVCDYYLIPDVIFRKTDKTQSFVMRRLDITNAIFIALIHARHMYSTPDDELQEWERVGLLKALFVARLFGLHVNQEYISGQGITETIMTGVKPCEELGMISVNQTVAKEYWSQPNYGREMMSRAFLLSLAFWRIANVVK